MSLLKSAKMYVDTDFLPTAWVAKKYDNPVIPNVKVAPNAKIKQENLLEGGNPGTFSLLDITNSSQTEETQKISITNLNLLANYEPKRHGKIDSIEFSFDLLNCIDSSESPTHQCTTTYSLLMLQDNVLYQSYPITLPTKAIKWRSYLLQNVQSKHFKSTGIPVQPNFTENASPIQFGYIVDVIGSGSFHSQTGIDNWKVIITHQLNPDSINSQAAELQHRLQIEKSERERIERQLIIERLKSDHEIREIKLEKEREVRTALLDLESRSKSCSSVSSSGSGSFSDSANYFDIVKSAQKKFREKEQECQDEKKALEECKQIIQNLQIDLDITKKNNEKVRVELENTIKDLSNVKNQSDQNNQIIFNLNEEIFKLNYENEKNLERINSLELSLDDVEIQKQDLMIKLSEFEIQLKEKEDLDRHQKEDLEDLQNLVDEFQQKIKKRKQNEYLMKQELESLRFEMESLINENEELVKSHNNEKEKIEKEKQDFESEMEKNVLTLKQILENETEKNKLEKFNLEKKIKDLTQKKIKKKAKQSEIESNLLNDKKLLEENMKKLVDENEDLCSEMEQRNHEKESIVLELKQLKIALENLERANDSQEIEKSKLKDSIEQLELLNSVEKQNFISQLEMEKKKSEEILQKETENMQNQINDLLNKNNKFEKRCVEIETKLEKSNNLNLNLNSKIQSLESDLANFTNITSKFSDLQESLDFTLSQKNNALNVVDNLNDEIEKLKSNIAAESKSKKKIEAELNQEKIDRKMHEEWNANSVNELLSEIKNYKDEIASMKDQLTVEIDLRQKAEAALRQLDEIFNVTSEDEPDRDVQS